MTFSSRAVPGFLLLPLLPRLLLVMLLASLAGCERSRPVDPGWPPDGGAVLVFPQSRTSELDLLFVIDNSSSMAGLLANFRSALGPFSGIRSTMGGSPDIHIGVISTDLGTEHNCGPSHCAHEASTTFIEDSITFSPRCRNYVGESLEDVIACIADLGTAGCDFEQPLESMRLALDSENAHNEGFLRETAVLAIVMITDEDDCSAKYDQLFDPTLDAPDGPLGPFTSFRCFEQGVTCDVDDRFAMGPRHNCVPREDAASQIHPVSRYVDFLDTIKDRQMVSVAIVGGPVLPSTEGDGSDVEVGPDENGNPMLQWSCSVAVDGAVPGIRLHAFAAAFNEPAALDTWAYTSICSGDLTPPLAGIGNTLALMEYQCLPVH